MRESNPRLDLGKVAYYHYTNPARAHYIYSTPPIGGQGARSASLSQFLNKLRTEGPPRVRRSAIRSENSGIDERRAESNQLP